LIEDAACSIGSSIDGRPVGSLADLTCFSFHPRKLLTSGEGGAITTSNPEYTRILEVKLAHGGVPKSGRFEFVDYGYNFRLPEIQAAMLIKQLDKLDLIVKKRREFQEVVSLGLESLGFIPQKVDHGVIHNVQSLTYRVPSGLPRDKLMESLRLQGIESTIGTYCMSGTPYYSKKYGTLCPNSKALEQTTITLPCHDGVEASRIVDGVKASV
jgi:dTDP-4-amino-4,6-dideoxygalactose transaminase